MINNILTLTERRMDRDLIRDMVIDEQRAELEGQRAYKARVEACSRVLKIKAGFKPDDKITDVKQLEEIASKLNARLFVVKEKHIKKLVKKFKIKKLIEMKVLKDKEEVKKLVKEKKLFSTVFHNFPAGLLERKYDVFLDKRDVNVSADIMVKSYAKDNDSEEQQKKHMKKVCFKAAHEIGHLSLDHDAVLSGDSTWSISDYRRYLDDEYEANYFAAALLLDEFSFRKDFMLKSKPSNLIAQCKNYGVSYETATHRYCTLAEKDGYNIHFMKVDEDGKILKRFSRSSKSIKWAGRKKLCQFAAARQVFSKKGSGIVYRQFTRLLDDYGKTVEILFCQSILKEEPEEGKKVSVSMGCLAKDAEEILGISLDDYPLVNARAGSCPYPRDEGEKAEEDEDCPLNLCGSVQTMSSLQGEINALHEKVKALEQAHHEEEEPSVSA